VVRHGVSNEDSNILPSDSVCPVVANNRWPWSS